MKHGSYALASSCVTVTGQTCQLRSIKVGLNIEMSVPHR